MTTPPRHDTPGRPIAITDEVIELIEQGASFGMSQTMLAGHVGVHRHTIANWFSRADPEGDNYDPRCAEALAAFRRGQSRGALGHLATLTQASRNGSVAAAKYMLDRGFGYDPGRPSVTVTVDATAAEQVVARTDVIDAEDGRVVDQPTTRRGMVEARLSRLQTMFAEAARDGSHQACAAIERQIAEAERDLVDLVAEGDAHMTEEGFLAELRTAATDMPEDHLRVFVDVWMDRHRMVAVSRDADPEAAKARAEG